MTYTIEQIQEAFDRAYNNLLEVVDKRANLRLADEYGCKLDCGEEIGVLTIWRVLYETPPGFRSTEEFWVKLSEDGEITAGLDLDHPIALEEIEEYMERDLRKLEIIKPELSHD